MNSSPEFFQEMNPLKHLSMVTAYSQSCRMMPQVPGPRATQFLYAEFRCWFFFDLVFRHLKWWRRAGLMKAMVPDLCLVFWQRCPLHWLVWLLVCPMRIWWSRLVDSLQYLYHCWVSRSFLSNSQSGWTFSLATFLYIQFARHGKSWKITIWWSLCLKLSTYYY